MGLNISKIRLLRAVWKIIFCFCGTLFKKTPNKQTRAKKRKQNQTYSKLKDFQCASGQTVFLKTLAKIFSVRFAGWSSETFLSAGDYSVGVEGRKVPDLNNE